MRTGSGPACLSLQTCRSPPAASAIPSGASEQRAAAAPTTPAARIASLSPTRARKPCCVCLPLHAARQRCPWDHVHRFLLLQRGRGGSRVCECALVRCRHRAAIGVCQRHAMLLRSPATQQPSNPATQQPSNSPASQFCMLVCCAPQDRPQLLEGGGTNSRRHISSAFEAISAIRNCGGNPEVKPGLNGE